MSAALPRASDTHRGIEADEHVRRAAEGERHPPRDRGRRTCPPRCRGRAGPRGRRRDRGRRTYPPRCRGRALPRSCAALTTSTVTAGSRPTNMSAARLRATVGPTNMSAALPISRGTAGPRWPSSLAPQLAHRARGSVEPPDMFASPQLAHRAHGSIDPPDMFAGPTARSLSDMSAALLRSRATAGLSRGARPTNVSEHHRGAPRECSSAAPLGRFAQLGHRAGEHRAAGHVRRPAAWPPRARSGRRTPQLDRTYCAASGTFGPWTCSPARSPDTVQLDHRARGAARPPSAQHVHRPRARALHYAYVLSDI